MSFAALAPDRGPWWTPADQAEWKMFTHELACGCVEHHERCPDCAVLRDRLGCTSLCPKIDRGFELAFEWLHARTLRSKAKWLRAVEMEALEARAA